MKNFTDKLFCRKYAVAMLIPAIVGNAVMLVFNTYKDGGFWVDMPIILLSLVYLSALKQIDEPKKFQCVPAFLMFWLTAARIVCCINEFGSTEGITVMIPIVVGCVYSLAGAVKLWREFFKNIKNTKGGMRQ